MRTERDPRSADIKSSYMDVLMVPRGLRVRTVLLDIAELLTACRQVLEGPTGFTWLVHETLSNGGRSTGAYVLSILRCSLCQVLRLAVREVSLLMEGYHESTYH